MVGTEVGGPDPSIPPRGDATDSYDNLWTPGRTPGVCILKLFQSDTKLKSGLLLTVIVRCIN